MEFCPHCGRHLKGRRDYCRNCGPKVCWWFENEDLVSKLGLTEEESWREENGEVHPRGWDRGEDGRFHPPTWVLSNEDGRFYPQEWVRGIDDIYRPRDWEEKKIQTI